jgi:putative iron-regulated protein
MPIPILALALFTQIGAPRDGAATPRPSPELRAEVLQGYADWCHWVYGECARRAEVLDGVVRRFIDTPTEEGLRAAREAWIDARRIYGLTEALRFCDGPIEAVEPTLNAWPLDEAYIDSVVGRPDCGIVNDVVRYPQIGPALLRIANERGGETNISLGWHAVEFLLWGQDLDPDGPGRRPWTDYVEGRATTARRRAEYLKSATGLLHPTLQTLSLAWAPVSGPARVELTEDPADGIRRILSGAIVLTSFELLGERLGVAYETQDQEQEHSCFSDTSHIDLVVNQAGIVALFTGEHAGRRFGPGAASWIRAHDTAVADDLARKLERTAQALAAIPVPFDRAMLGPDDAPGRVAMRAALDALAEQTDAIAVAARKLGLSLPLEPGG